MLPLKVRWLRTALAAAGIVSLLVVGLAFVQMTRHVLERIEALATSNSDSTQWSLAQSDVEILALQTAIADANSEPPGPLSLVRTRFDVFFSRMDTISTSPLFQSFRDNPETIETLKNIGSYLEKTVPLIDSDDLKLRESLQYLKEQTVGARTEVRKLNLKGVNILSRESDKQRLSIAETLSRVSVLALSLFVILFLAVLLLLHFFRRVRQRATEQSQIRSRLGAMLSTSLDAVVAVDAHGTVVDFNGAAERIFGYRRQEAVGQQMDSLIVPDHLKQAHQTGMQRYRTTREKNVIGKGRVQLEARRKNGEVFPVELSIATADAEEGEIFVSFIRDISRRLAAEQELIKARDKAVAGEKAKADLIAVMSHEMRTPLNGMLGTLELLDDEKRSSKDSEYLDIMRASGKLLLHHVNNVLEISRAEAGKIEIASTTFSVHALIRELVESQHGVSEHRGNTLSQTVEMHEQDYAVGDPTRIRQVLLNLIGNAIKFTRNGMITVEAKRLSEGDLVEFRVTDSGIGIPPADREAIFEDFVTLDPSFSRAVGGTGLGLAIVRRLVEAMNGEVGLESSSGVGSSFWVRLPLAAAQRDVPAEQPAVTKKNQSADAMRVSPLKILVVEDNQINRFVVRNLLEKDGHKVDEATNGQQGLEFSGRKSYDLVLMDISMPVMDGIEATRAIRASEHPGTHLPIVALTANAIPSEKDRFFAAGLDDILIKPVTLSGLRELLNKFSNASQCLSENPDEEAFESFEMMVNHRHLDDLSSALGPEKINSLIKTFVVEMDEEIARISDSLESGDIEEGLRERVHHAAGSSALLGAEILHSALAKADTRLVKKLPFGSGDGQKLAEIWFGTASELRLHLKTN